MTNAFVFRFNASDLKTLTDQLPNTADYILVSCGINIVQISGQPTATLKVEAEGFKKTAGSPGVSVGTKQGCPVPPCLAG